MKRRRWRYGAGALALIFGACSEDAASSGAFPADRSNACVSNGDCGLGLVCVTNQCVSPEDLLPPDVELRISADAPAASARYLFALSPDNDGVAIIDAATLAIEAVTVPAAPVAIAVLPGVDAALVLSRDGRAVTRLSMETGQLEVTVQRLRRRFSSISVSPDGRWAVAWTNATLEPDQGAEGLIAIIGLQGGDPIELAAGYRHTDVLFRTRGGVSERAIIVGKDEAVIVDLANAGDRRVPPRVRLPDAFADVDSREVVSAPDGRFVLLRAVGAPELAALSVDTATVTRIALPAIATDLDIVATGTLAVAALRASSQVLLLPVPEALTSSRARILIDVRGVSAGQLELSQDARFAAIFSGQDGSESVGWLDLATRQLRVIDRLRKQVRAVGVAPSGDRMVIIHQADPNSTVADSYEREVDMDEGYSVVDIASGFAQLKRTNGVAPAHLVFTETGAHAVITLRDDARVIHRVEVADMASLVISSRSLGSMAQHAGALPGGERVWVTQAHPAGRISFVDTASAELRTVTGYYLNAGIE